MTKLDIARKRVELLAGRVISIKVNEGRNRFIVHEGYIDQIHPSIFTVRTVIHGGDRTLSFTYVDVLAKIVRFYPVQVKSDKEMS